MEGQRRLITVLFADIVGYTALMQRDEKLAMVYLNHFKKIVEDIISEYEGEIIQYYGDAVLLTFRSAVEGVDCAIKLQLAFIQKEIPLRIGIHLGDVIFKNKNVFGDGVNIASRIESIGVPGSILISKTTRDQLVNKGDYFLHSMGLFNFKNVNESMEVFAIVNERLVVPKRNQMQGKLQDTSKRKQKLWLVPIIIFCAMLFIELFNIIIQKFSLDPVFLDLLSIITFFVVIAIIIYFLFNCKFNKLSKVLQILNGIITVTVLYIFLSNPLAFNPEKLRIFKLYKRDLSELNSLKSVAVLPFSNFTGNKIPDYLLAGMQDGLITEIGQLGTIKIISQTSTLAYSESKISIQKIAKQLDVDALVECTVTLVDSLLSLQLKLIKAFPKEEVIWAHSFNTSIGKLPILYQEATKNVVRQLNSQLSNKEIKQLSSAQEVNAEAYKYYLKGLHQIWSFTDSGYIQGEQYFNESLKIDSNYVMPYLGLASLWKIKAQVNLTTPNIANQKIKYFNNIASKLAPFHPEVLSSKSHTFFSNFNWEEGLRNMEACLELDPNRSQDRAIYAHMLMILNRWEEAWKQIEYAEEIDPQNPMILTFKSIMFFNSGKVLSGFKMMEKLRILNPDGIFIQHYLIKKFKDNKPEIAIEAAKNIFNSTLRYQPIIDVLDQAFQETRNYKYAMMKAMTLIENSHNLSYIPPFLMLQLFSEYLDEDKYFYYFNKMYEEKNPNLPYFAIRNNSSFQNDNRYEFIIREIGLWQPEEIVERKH